MWDLLRFVLRKGTKSYREREEELFDRWRTACSVRDGIDPESDFAADGVLFRGAYKQPYGCWERQPGNETELWDSSKVRLLILTKDTTRASEMCDVRIETARKNGIVGHVEMAPVPFYRNLAVWSYGLQNALKGGAILSYNELPDWETLREHYASAPIARVNCKKQIGSSTVADDVLVSHMERYSDFLAEQIEMYDADIILCCGGRSTIKDFVKRYYLTDLQLFSKSDAWVYYSPSTRKVVIDSYHPTYPKSWENIERCYEDMMSDLRNFLRVYPEYIRR